MFYYDGKEKADKKGDDDDDGDDEFYSEDVYGADENVATMAEMNEIYQKHTRLLFEYKQRAESSMNNFISFKMNCWL